MATINVSFKQSFTYGPRSNEALKESKRGLHRVLIQTRPRVSPEFLLFRVSMQGTGPFMIKQTVLERCRLPDLWKKQYFVHDVGCSTCKADAFRLTISVARFIYINHCFFNDLSCHVYKTDFFPRSRLPDVQNHAFHDVGCSIYKTIAFSTVSGATCIKPMPFSMMSVARCIRPSLFYRFRLDYL